MPRTGDTDEEKKERASARWWEERERDSGRIEIGKESGNSVIVRIEGKLVFSLFDQIKNWLADQKSRVFKQGKNIKYMIKGSFPNFL